MTRITYLLLGLAGILGFSSCGSGSLAEKEMELETNCWSISDSLELDYSNTDTSQVMTMEFPFTFSESYPFNNIYFNLQVATPSGQVNELPLSFTLMDPQGNWYGEPSGEDVSIRFDLGNMLMLNQLGDYRFKLYHYMRNENLCGIQRVGIALKKADKASE